MFLNICWGIGHGFAYFWVPASVALQQVEHTKQHGISVCVCARGRISLLNVLGRTPPSLAHGCDPDPPDQRPPRGFDQEPYMPHKCLDPLSILDAVHSVG